MQSRIVQYGLLSVALLALSAAPGRAAERVERAPEKAALPAVDIVHPPAAEPPKSDGKVQRVTVVCGTLTEPGRPVLLVRPLLAEEQWWAQEEVRMQSPRQFAGVVVFGHDKTPIGTEFEVVAILVQREEDAKRLRSGQAFDKLPDGLKRSRIVTYTLAAPEANGRLRAVISQPANHGSVGRQAVVWGRKTTAGTPVLLVRAVQANSPWWVQDSLEMLGPYHFRGRARFGNARTPEGAKFEMRVVVTQNPQFYQPGTFLRTLPIEPAHSKPIEVRLHRSQ